MASASDGPAPPPPAAAPASVQGAPGRLTTAEIAALSLNEVLARLEPDRAVPALALVDWLNGSPQREIVESIVEHLCARLIAAGIPLDRYGSSTSMVTADHDAIGRVWRRDEGVEEVVYVRPDVEVNDYRDSPFYASAETRTWLELWLPDTPDSRFGVVASLKAFGLTHYICVPMWLTNGANGWITFATKRATGFSEQDLLVMAIVLPPLMSRIDSRVGWTTLDKLLRTYVGDEPHTAILAGRAKRGQVSTIRAAMLVADLRDSTGHTAEISAVEAVDLFNNLFDCLVPPVESRHGEVLKYLGDGLLAIFRESTDVMRDAAARALQAAEAAMAAVEAWNAAHPAHRPMQIGIALHYGEIAYGNIGSGSRLDFTVIGRDVGLATRIAGMNAKLGQPLLLSAAFVGHLEGQAERIGVFPARGFRESVEVFRPKARRGASRREPALAKTVQNVTATNPPGVLRRGGEA